MAKRIQKNTIFFLLLTHHSQSLLVFFAPRQTAANTNTHKIRHLANVITTTTTIQEKRTC